MIAMKSRMRNLTDDLAGWAKFNGSTVMDGLATNARSLHRSVFRTPFSTGFLLDDMGFADRLPVV